MRVAGQTSTLRAELRARCPRYPRGGPGYVKICGADIVAGRVLAQLFQLAQFLSKCAHCLCLLVGGLPDSSLCVCVCVCLCVRACVRACVRLTML